MITCLLQGDISLMARCIIGLPDLIAFICLFSTSIYSVIVPPLQYISLGIEKYGIENVSLIIACYKEDDTNVTCKHMGDTIAEDLSSLTVYVNTVKAVFAPIFVILLGGYSDAVGKKFAINSVLFINVLWCIALCINTIFPTKYPSWIYVIANGFLLGINGGSTFTVNNFLTGYLSITTPPSKQAGRFGLLLGFGLIGYVTGPIVCGLIMSVTTKYWIIGMISTSLMLSALMIGIFCLKPLETETISSEAQKNGFCERFSTALKFQYQNTIDLFKYQSFLGKYLGANFMYMLSSVGLISPIVVLSNVYLLAPPFKWSTGPRSYFMAGKSKNTLFNLTTVAFSSNFQYLSPVYALYYDSK